MKIPFHLFLAFLLPLCVYFIAIGDPGIVVFLLIISSWSAALMRWNTIRGEYNPEEYLRKNSAKNHPEISAKQE